MLVNFSISKLIQPFGIGEGVKCWAVLPDDGGKTAS